LITDDQFSNANPLRKASTVRIVRFVKPLIEDGIIPVISGFIGRTRDGRISTLGRGGSDTTALLLATALQADEVVLVTSSPGILTGDPILIRNTRTIPRIDMKALVGIADAGTKFIHRKALRFKDPDINIRVVSNSTGHLDGPGTLVTGNSLPELDVTLHNPHPVASVTLVGKDLPQRPELVKKVTQAARTDLVAVSQDSHSAIFYLKQSPRLKRLVNRLHAITIDNPAGVAVATRLGMALIVVKGVGLEDTPGVIARISDTLRTNEINIFGILTVTSSVHVLVDWKTRKRAAHLIKNSLEN
ncbi:MAG TPA: ACT domain-containing protein, partial [Candidatus Bathyarchaeia archaeon]|nr:ACT domain-containing protein [Candidatus Bathyarchaeia archaeon]